jgi:hypothetical protein
MAWDGMYVYGTKRVGAYLFDVCKRALAKKRRDA